MGPRNSDGSPLEEELVSPRQDAETAEPRSYAWVDLVGSAAFTLPMLGTAQTESGALAPAATVAFWPWRTRLARPWQRSGSHPALYAPVPRTGTSRRRHAPR
jgi:hypothetical protein